MRNGKRAALAVAVTAMAGLSAMTAGQAVAQDKELTFAVITHAQPGDTFWDIIRKGATAAAEKDQASAVKAAQAAGIPIIGFNAGVNQWRAQNLIGYAGQDESVAGKAVGEQLNKDGAKDVVCLDQQQGAVQLEARCQGIKDTFKGKVDVLYVTGYDMPTVKARLQAKLQQDPSVDYVVTLGAPFAPVAFDAVGAAGSSAKVGTFDMTPVVIDQIAQGKIQWAVDQQPYVEGYESVDMLWLYIKNGDTVGGGGPVLTGPFFVNKDNAAAVAKYAKAGTR